MRVRQENLPLAINASMSAIRYQLLEYLRLEDSTYLEEGDIQFRTFLVVNDVAAFVIFEYPSEEGRGLGFLQYDLHTDWRSGCLGSWPIDANSSEQDSIKEYLSYNPLPP